MAERYSGLIAAMDNAVAQGLTVHMATRATCAEHIEHGDDKATEPLTAAAFADSEALRLLRRLIDVSDSLAMFVAGEVTVIPDWYEAHLAARAYLAAHSEDATDG